MVELHMPDSKKYWVLKVEGLASAIGLIKMGPLNGLPIEADEIGPLFIEMASILIFLNYVILKQLLNSYNFVSPSIIM